MECFLPLELRDPSCPGRKLEPLPGSEFAWLPSPRKAAATPDALPPPAESHSWGPRLFTSILIRVVFVMGKRVRF